MQFATFPCRAFRGRDTGQIFTDVKRIPKAHEKKQRPSKKQEEFEHALKRAWDQKWYVNDIWLTSKLLRGLTLVLSLVRCWI